MPMASDFLTQAIKKLQSKLQNGQWILKYTALMQVELKKL